VNIKVCKDTGHTHITGGEYAIPSLEIHIDRRLSKREKEERIIHAVIEVYFRSIPHDKVDEITADIMEALDQI